MKIDNKTFREILIILWGLLLIFNLWSVLSNESMMGWFLVGFNLGGILILLIDAPLINSQNKILRKMFALNRKLLDQNINMLKRRKKKK